MRVKIARFLGVSAGNVFSLLKRIGEDGAGAVSLVSPERESRISAEAQYRILSEEETHEVLMSLPERPLNVGAENFHVSGVGAFVAVVCIAWL